MVDIPQSDGLVFDAVARTSGMRHVERIVGPRLRLLIADEAMSFREAAEILSREHDVRVHEETLRRWAADLGLPPRRPRVPTGRWKS